MTGSRGLWIAAALALPLLAANVAAQEHSKPDKNATPDPNEVICRKEPVVGSRLQMSKTCMTRAQWAEQRQQDRQAIERVQAGSCQRQGGC